MNKFSIEECKILWIKNHKIPKRDKQAIKTDLFSMPDLIEEALSYSKERAKRWTEVSFQLNTKNDTLTYYLKIRYEPVEEGWHIEIEVVNSTIEIVGEIVSEKWSLAQMFPDEYYKHQKKLKHNILHEQ
jgi:hypothetical protein